MDRMEVLFMTLFFYAIALLGAGLATVLLVRSIRADGEVDNHPGRESLEPVAEPAWVHRRAA
jgi:hypothetical protein